MTSNLTLGINTVIIICTSVILLGPLFYWLLTNTRPHPAHH